MLSKDTELVRGTSTSLLLLSADEQILLRLSWHSLNFVCATFSELNDDCSSSISWNKNAAWLKYIRIAPWLNESRLEPASFYSANQVLHLQTKSQALWGLLKSRMIHCTWLTVNCLNIIHQFEPEIVPATWKTSDGRHQRQTWVWYDAEIKQRIFDEHANNGRRTWISCSPLKTHLT